MTGRSDCITDAPLVELATVWFVLIDSAYATLEHHYGRWRQRGPVPDFSDSEVITVALLIDTVFHGHEALGLSRLRADHPTLFPRLPQPGHFNTRRTCLGPLIEQLRRLLATHYGLLDPQVPDRLVDSAPIPICTYQRAKQNRTLIGAEYFGRMHSRSATFYGLRLHLSVTPQQVVDTWLLAPASVHDSQVLPALLAGEHDRVLVGDGAYLVPVLAPVLRANHNIVLVTPPQRTTRPPWPRAPRRWVVRLRRRIETALSVVSVVWGLQAIGARSLPGLVCRISTRLLAYTLLFVTDQLLAGRLTVETPN